MAIYLIRHGETAWTVGRRHTGRTDLPLTAAGEAQARDLGRRLAGLHFSAVWTSPRQRALRTAALAGFGDRAQPMAELAEYDYGRYEGLTTPEIRAERPGWELWRDGCPDGEDPAAVMDRARAVLARVGPLTAGGVALFGHGHMLRAVAAAHLGAGPELARGLILGVGGISILSEEHGWPAIEAWNLR